MGQTLSEPVTTKETTAGQDELLAFGASAMQGWRIHMEDAHTTILDLKAFLNASASSAPSSSIESRKNAFFAVFDGHGGSAVAKYAGQHLHRKLASSELYKQEKYPEALKAAYLGMDTDMLNDPNHEKDSSGCTAVSAIITHDWKVFVANAGDSRAVLSANGVAEALSVDHKPTNPGETKRIVNAGGFVDFGRVNGNLALSRALGDFDFKKNAALPAEDQIVTADPEITERQLLDTDEFLIIACDGIWDVMSNKRAVDFVSLKIADGFELPQICEHMMEACLASSSDQLSLGCDNMTVIIVALYKNKTREQWIADIKHRVATTLPSSSLNDEEGIN